MKKIISLILAIMMLAAIFTGCGSKEPAQEAAAEETAVRNDFSLDQPLSSELFQ